MPLRSLYRPAALSASLLALPGAAVDVGRGVSVEPYGDGKAPVLPASVAVELAGTWPGNAAVLTGAVPERVLACYVNGRFVRLARYPNEGSP